MNTKKWTMRDGTKIRICDMSDGHLSNTIAMLRRNHFERIWAAESFAASVNGDMASYYAEQDVVRMMSVESEHPLVADLLEEADRRGLQSLPAAGEG